MSRLDVHDETVERLEAHVAAALQRAGVETAAYAVVRDGEVVLRRGIGRTAGDGGEPASPDTLFGIGSLTKSMTAAALLQLQERGRLDLDRPVQDYVPWFRTADGESSSRITVRHLLNQTSGLGNGAWRVALDDPSLHASLERAVRAMAACPPIREPGATWAYSNAGFSVAGHVIEAVSGVPYAQYLAENVFAPCGMTGSTCDIPTAERRGYARPRQVRLGRQVEVPIRMDPAFAPAGMALYSSANDMARYLMAWMKGGLVGADSRSEAWRGQARPPHEGMGRQYGLGWMITELHGHEMVFHHGGTEGHSAAMCIVPGEDVAVVILAGVASTEPTNIALDMMRILLGAEPTGTGGLPNVERALAGVGLTLGACGVALGGAAAAAAVTVTAPPLWSALVVVGVIGCLWLLTRVLRRSQWSPFPVPMNVGGWGWGTGLALGWCLCLGGGLLWTLVTLWMEVGA